MRAVAERNRLASHANRSPTQRVVLIGTFEKFEHHTVTTRMLSQKLGSAVVDTLEQPIITVSKVGRLPVGQNAGLIFGDGTLAGKPSGQAVEVVGFGIVKFFARKFGL